MARPKGKDGKSSAAVVPRRDKEAEAEAQLRAYHALGRKVLARIEDGELDAATLRALHEETGYGFDNLRKARVFARLYTPEQLDALCRLRTPSGRPLPWRHVRQLLMLPPGAAREALQRKAAERGWGLEELDAAIPGKVRREQTRREGGRPFVGPRTVADGLRRIVRHGDEWLRRYGSRAWSGDDWLRGKVGAAGPGGLKARLAEAREVLREVRESVAELEGQAQAVRGRDGGGPTGRAGEVAADPGEGEVGASPVAAAPRLNPDVHRPERRRVRHD